MKPQFEVPEPCNMPLVSIRGRYYGEKCFPSLNNLIAAYGRRPVIGNSMKRKYQDICIWEIRSQLKGWRASKPLVLHYRFFEPDRGQKRDVTNVYYLAGKIFADALQDCGVIPDDGPKWLVNETHDFVYVGNDGIGFDVYLEEVEA